MDAGELGRNVVSGAFASAGVGALAGALESWGHVVFLRQPLGAGEFALLGLTAASLGLLVGFLVGAVGGVAHLVARDAATGTAAQTGLTAAVFAGWYAWPAAALLASEGRLAAAALTAASPVALAVLAGLNVRVLHRRQATGRSRLRVLPVASALSVGLVASGVAVWSMRHEEGLPGGRAVVIVSVDGLSYESAFGPDAALAAHAAEAVRFRDAVTPLPATRPAAATVLTALHPLRHEVVTDDRRLGRAYAPIAEVVGDAGYATAAFVSSSSLDVESGLAQGFTTYDEARRSGPGSVSWLRRLPAQPARRPAPATAAAFADWVDGRSDGFLAWVHLDAFGGPGAVGDALVGIDAALAAAGRTDDTLVIVASSYGGVSEPVPGRAFGLDERVVRVPLWIRAPGLAVTVPDVPAQVRLVDLAPTAVAWLGLPSLEPSEGVDLLAYATGGRARSLACTLVGADLDGVPLIGLRDGAVKFVRRVPDGPERLYDLGSDPLESRDLAPTQPDAVAQARGLVGADESVLRALLGATP